ncbi:MAG: ATPase, T2SS/T4P/T4SS family [Pseudomonadota bacterium]|nr:ATPase, T2SS/T4P/T4SS family [Pseudomonadota bacterium]
MVYVSKNQSTTLQLEDSGRHDKDANQAVEVLDALLEKATHQGASHIHIEPQQDLLRIRQRVDGILVVTHSLPKELARRLISRIKVLAHLDISERRLPQDGRIKHAAMSERADVRISTLPSLWGEKAVLRLLDHAPTERGLDALGMDRAQQEQFTRALDQPQGLILVTGPTGSGKTLTLYSGLRHLNNEQSNVITVEDPVEIRLRGANQIAVNTNLVLALRRFYAH